MRISKIALKDFRNHANSLLDIGDSTFVVVRGDIHAGKTSIAHAISMTLTPTAEGLDELGRGFYSKIRYNQPKAIVDLRVMGDVHTIDLHMVLNSNTVGRTFESMCVDDPDWKPLPFENFLAYYKDSLRVATTTDYFLLLDETKQKNLLARLVLPERYDFDPEITEEVDKFIGQGIVNWKGEPFAAIAIAYKKLYEERTIINRVIRDFTIPESIILGTDDTSESIQREIDEARKAQTEIQRKKDSAIAAYSQKQQKRARLEERIGSLTNKVREQTEARERIIRSILSDNKLKSLRAFVVHEPEYRKLEQERRNTSDKIDMIRKEMQDLEDGPDPEAPCPTCGRPMDVEAFKARGGNLSVELAKLTTRDGEISARMVEIGGIDEMLKQIKAHDAAASEKREIESILVEKQKSLADAQKELAGLDAAEDPSAQFNQPLLEAADKVQTLYEKLRPVIAAEERRTEIDRRVAELDKHKVKADKLKKLVAEFDKDGIKARLLSEHTGKFTNKINQVMGAWGYRCELSIEPDYQFVVSDTIDRKTPVRELSGSERLWFSVALQCAVSQAAGIGFIVADRFDTFSADARSDAARRLYELLRNKSLEQVFILVTDLEREISGLQGSVYFFVEDGNVTKLTR